MSAPKTTDSQSLLELRPLDGEMLKAAELIEVEQVAGRPLSLYARRVYNILLHNAHGPDMAEPGREFSIPTASLKFSHKSIERLDAAVLSLMQTVISIQHSDGSRERANLIGWTSLDDQSRERGVLRYSFHPKLARMLQDSRIFARLRLDVVHAVSSKYALALYELIAKRARLTYVHSEVFEVDRLRDLLGVEEGKLSTYSNFLKAALQPAVDEVNRFAEFGVAFEPVNRGRKVVAVRIAWAMKDVEGQKRAYAALRGEAELIGD